jgi:hypothetical protein
MCEVNISAKAASHLLMSSLSQCALVPLACGVLYSGAARKPCIPVSTPTPPGLRAYCCIPRLADQTFTPAHQLTPLNPASSASPLLCFVRLTHLALLGPLHPARPLQRHN